MNKSIKIFSLILVLLIVFPLVNAAEETGNLSNLSPTNFCSSDLNSEYPIDCALAIFCDTGVTHYLPAPRYYILNITPMLPEEDIQFNCTTIYTYSGPIPAECNPEDYACGDPCEDDTGETVNPIGCECVSVPTTSTERFCCGEGDGYVSNEIITECSVSEFNISGHIIFSDSEDELDGFIVQASGNIQTTSDSNGLYELANVSEGNVVISAGKTIDNLECSGFTTISDLQFNQENVDIDITCDTAGANSCELAGYVCCAEPTGDIIDDYGNACDAGYSCVEEEDCGCSPNTCYIDINSICAASGSYFIPFNLAVPSEKIVYCANCSFDSDCAQATCAPSPLCDGEPNFCTDPDDDPDAGVGYCNYTEQKWCDAWGESTLPNLPESHWLYETDDHDIYCSNCPLDDDCVVICGDGIYEEGGEDCDYSVISETTGNIVWTHEDWFNMGELDYGCGGYYHFCEPYECYCNPVTSTCDGNMWEPNMEDCDGDHVGICSFGEVCDENCECESSQNDCYSDPFDLLVEPSLCDDDVLLTIISPNDCYDLIVNVNLYLCEDETCDSDSLGAPLATFSQTELNNGANTYGYDNNLVAGAEYYFTLGVDFDSSRYPQQEFFEGVVYDLTAGDDECISWGENNSISCTQGICDNGDLLKCSDGSDELLINSLIENCDVGWSCYNSDEGADCTQLLDVDLCQECSGVTGLFMYGSEWDQADPCSDEPDPTTCCYYRFNSYPAYPVQSCFMDSQYSIVDKVKACQDITSCYDYLSEESCNFNDPCGLSSDELFCQWSPYNLQTGQGVCRPSVEEFQECSRALDYKNNNVFLYSILPGEDIFPASSKRVCELYGNCYYGIRNDDRSFCKNQDELICSDFFNSEDCDGGEIYDFNSSTFEILSYSNTIINESSKCVWIEDGEECIRDSNLDTLSDNTNSNHNDFLPVFVRGNFFGVPHSDIPAQRDFVNPVTEISERPLLQNRFGKNPEIEFTVSDNLHVPENMQTYFCIANRTNGDIISVNPINYVNATNISSKCDPNDELSNNNWHRAEDGTMSISENYLNEGQGTYDIYFFSLDGSLNLEQIKTMTIVSDWTMPNVTFTYTTEVHEYEEETYSTLFITIEVGPESYCEGYLEEIVVGNPIFPFPDGTENMSGMSDEFYLTYTGVYDGLYKYYLTCTHPELNNINSSVISMRIQGDTRIYDSTPYFEAKKDTTLELSVKTLNNAICYYNYYHPQYSSQEDQMDFNDMKAAYEGVPATIHGGKFDAQLIDDDYYLHSVDLIYDNYSNVYSYDVACNITTYTQENGNSSELVGPDDADRIIFSQDYESPSITPYVREDNEEFVELNSGNWYNHPHINLTCIDSEIFSINNEIRWFSFGGDMLNAGCDDIDYDYVWTAGQESGSSNSHPIPFYLNDENTVPSNNSGGTTYDLTIFGDDELGNAQAPVNFEVIVDDRVPGADMEAYYGIVLAEVLYGKIYSIVIDPHEPLSGGATLRFSVGNTFSEATSEYVDIGFVESELHASFNPLDQNSYYGLLNNTKRNITFRLSITDTHGLNNNVGDLDFVYLVDTEKLPEPILEPLLSLPISYYNDIIKFFDLLGNKYSVIYQEENIHIINDTYSDLTKTYYTTEKDLLITGYTDHSIPVLNLSLMKANFDDNESEISYSKVNMFEQNLSEGIDQDNATANATTLDNSVLNKKNDTIIYLNCSTCNFGEWVGNYVMLPHSTYLVGANIQTENAFGKVTTYGEYSTFYNVITNGTNIDGEFITISPALESNLSTDELAFMYESEDGDTRNDYLELNSNIKQYYPYCSVDRLNAYSLRIKSETANKQAYTQYPIKLFLDDQAPELWNYSFNEQSTPPEPVSPLGEINFIIKEHQCGSGLDLNNSNVIINDEFISLNNITLNPIVTTTDFGWVVYEFSYVVEEEVQITFDVKDYAGNEMINENDTLTNQNANNEDFEFTLDVPTYLNSNNSIEFTANINTSEKHLMFNLTRDNSSYEILDPLRNNDNNEYYPIIRPQELGCVEDGGDCCFGVTAFDDYGNDFTNYSVCIGIDNTAPDINITNITANKIYPSINLSIPFSDWNISTRDLKIIIEGKTNEDIDNVCMKFDFQSSAIIGLGLWECQERCGEYSPDVSPCINETGQFRFTFDLNFIPEHVQNDVIYNYIRFKATDFARNVNQDLLSILIDYQPPVYSGYNIN